jgi:hypothetical protein
MTFKPGTREMYSQDSIEASTSSHHGGEAKPTISFADFSKRWRSEVPKVVQAHEDHRQEVRRNLGLD